MLTPYNCLSCQAEGALICKWCWPEAFDEVPDRCYRCKRASKESAVCKKCRSSSPLSHVWVSTTYEKHAKTVIQGMKLSSQREAARMIAQRLHETAPFLPGAVIAYVPTAASRVRQRSFDHNKLIAREFARLRSLPCDNLLTRLWNAQQVGAPRKERLKQAHGSYEARRPIPKNAHVIIIDDVTTTGATIEEVARIIKRAGAKKVSALIFAQTV